MWDLREFTLYLLKTYQQRIVHLSKKMDGIDVSHLPFVLCVDELFV